MSAWPNWQQIQDYVALRAPVYGVDPGIATRVTQLESGSGSQFIGDDGSSFGPFQLHYGGLSGQLGISFTPLIAICSGCMMSGRIFQSHGRLSAAAFGGMREKQKTHDLSSAILEGRSS
jgi:hypothetical protein